MQTKLNTLGRSNDAELLGSIADELGVGKLTWKMGGGQETHTSIMIPHSEYLASVSSHPTLKKRKLETVDVALLGMV